MAQLADIDREWKTGDRGRARELATEYVNANPDRFAAYESLTIPELVGFVSTFRANGNEEGRQLVDAFLLARHEPQKIGGEMRVGR